MGPHRFIKNPQEPLTSLSLAESNSEAEYLPSDSNVRSPGESELLPNAATAPAPADFLILHFMNNNECV